MLHNSLPGVLQRIRFSSLGLRSRLLIFMAIVAVPIILLIVYNVDQRRQREIEMVQNHALSLAQLAASTQHQRVESARQLLIAITQTPDIIAQNVTACNSYLGQLLPEYPHYGDIVALTASGEVICSASSNPSLAFSDSSILLNNVIETGNFSTTDIYLNLISGEPNITYAQPLHDEVGDLSGVMILTESLNWLNDWFRTVDIPFGAHLIIFNNRGTVVTHYPPQSTTLGQLIVDQSMLEAMRTQVEGVLDTRGHHGVPSLHGFTRIEDLPSDMYIAVSITKSTALAEVNASISRNIVLISVITLGFFGLAWYGGTRVIIEPINQLNRTVQKLIAGEENPHTNVNNSVNELISLAYAIDQLSNALYEREKEAKNAVVNLKQTIGEYEQLKAQLNQALQEKEQEIDQRKRAQQANNLKLRFLGMVAHELQTPLTSIKGFATTLLADDVVWDEANQRQFLQIIDEETDNVVELVTQLLDLSQIESGMMRIHPTATCISEVVRKAEPHLNALADKHILNMTLLDEKMLPVYADPKRITQVLINLVSNAAKYSELNTQITIEAQQEPMYVQVNVIDEGIGIKPEDLKRVFKPFIRSEKWLEQREGSGLGLAICKGIIEAHGGKIWAEAHADKPGTTISFTLPLAKSAENTPEQVVADESN